MRMDVIVMTMTMMIAYRVSAQGTVVVDVVRV